MQLEPGAIAGTTKTLAFTSLSGTSNVVHINYNYPQSLQEGSIVSVVAIGRTKLMK